MLTFKHITLDNLQEFAGFIVSSEMNYPSDIRTTIDDFSYILEDENIFLVALLDGRYVGNVVGYPLTKNDMDEDCFAGQDPENNRIMYLFNIVVDPVFQGRGFGSILLREFVRVSKEKGYEKVLGHFRQNGSLRLFEKEGGQRLKLEKDWEGCGEDYFFCELELAICAPCIHASSDAKETVSHM
ncbi:TPA: GNAT family N-acetyltransferase [Candidatus Woesearchaeota archaeon]|nr:GNAT family N-acetyltransferase [Candidatus Woesearchaeota archaeon]